MLFNTFLATLALSAAAPFVASVPLASSPTTNSLAARQLDEAVSVIVYASVAALGVVTTDLCVNIEVAAGLDLPTIVQAQVQALLGPLATAEICLAVGEGTEPTCDDGGLAIGTGCGFRCLDGFTLVDGECVPTGASQLPRRFKRTRTRRSLCASSEETACPLSGIGSLSNSDVVSGRFDCVDLSSAVDSCGSCGNVCSGTAAACSEGLCINL